MIQNFFKKNIEFFAAIGIFLIVSCAYFYPALKGYAVKMGDIKSFSGMAKEVKDYRAINNDEESLWTGTSFSGMPNYQISLIYFNPLKKIQSSMIKIISFPVFFLFISFLSFYIMGRSFNVGFYIAMIGALAYGLVTYNMLILEAGHRSKMMAIAYAPGVIAGMILMYRKEKWLFPFSLLTLFFSLELMSNHIQMTYYFIFVMIAIGIAELIRYMREKAYKSFILKTCLILGAGIIGLLSNFNYFNTYEYAKYTTRGKPVITINSEGVEESNTNQSSGLNRDYIVQWCYGKGETWNLLFPTAKGDRTVVEKQFEELKSSPATYNYVVENYQKNQGKLFGYYWGDQPFTGGPNYVGAIVIFLALLYLVFVQTALKWGLLSVSILSVLLSWGDNLGGSVDNMWLTNFFIDYIPLYSKFRTVSSILVIINLLAPLMAILFLTYLSNNLKWAKKQFKVIAGVGLMIIVVLVGITHSDAIGLSSKFEEVKLNELINEYQQNKTGVNPLDAFTEVEEIRKGIFLSDVWRSLQLILVAFGLILLYIKKENLGKYSFLGITLLIVFDLWGINTRYFNNDKNPKSKRNFLAWEKKNAFSNTYDATQGDLAIYQMENSQNPKIEQQTQEFLSKLDPKDKRNRKNQERWKFASLNFNTNYRVMDLDNPFNSSRVSYFHKTTGGYNPAKLKRYQDVIDFYISKELQYLNTRELDKMKVMNMLNNKYYLYQGQVFAQNQNAYGNAWLVNNVKWVEDNNAEILAIEDSDVRNTAIIHTEFKNQITGTEGTDPNASIQMINYSPMHISYDFSSNNDELAVFSEVYYKNGWNAYIDGNKVEYGRANYILRALNIPKGNHTIDFKFESNFLTITNTFNLLGFLIMFFAFSAHFYTEWKSKRVNTIAVDE